jgi:hypothetical protein
MCDPLRSRIPRCNALDPHKETVLLYNNISQDTVWTCDKNWVVMNQIQVLNNSTLAIDEGATVFFNSPDFSDPRSVPSLIVTQGSRLFADGCCERPITFTSILTLCEIFAVNNKKSWVYNGGIGPFSSLWGGIVLCGNNVTNLVQDGIAINLPGYSVKYGGDVTNNNNCVMNYCRIYFAGSSGSVNVNSLTLAACSYNCTFQNLEVMFGQGDGIAVWGGDALVKQSVVGFKYQGNHVALYDGAQVSVVQSILIDGYSNADLSYKTNGKAFVYVDTTGGNEEVSVNRNSVVNVNNCDLFSLNFRQYYFRAENFGVFRCVNNLYVGPCDYVHSVPFDSPYAITSICPSAFDPEVFYIGPCAYEQISGEYYIGPTSGELVIPAESGQLLKKITYLTNGYNNQLLLCGRFLDIAPVPTSDAYKSITDDAVNTHLLPFICEGFRSADVNLNLGLLNMKTSYHAAGVIDNEHEESEWCLGLFGKFLVVCRENECGICHSSCSIHYNPYKNCVEAPPCEPLQCPPPHPHPPHPPCPPHPPHPPCPPPHPHPHPCHSETTSSSSSSSSSGSVDMGYHPHASRPEDSSHDLLMKGLVAANLLAVGAYVMKSIYRSTGSKRE